MSRGTVAVIGAGVGGLSAARYLTSQGFDVTVLESHSDLGGQWNRHNPNSGVWPQMRTNTARFVTKLSDVDYPDHVSVFPRNGEVLDMLRAFAESHDLLRCIRFSAEVTGLGVEESGYRVEWRDGAGTHSEVFDRAVVASGRFNLPEVPSIPGLDDFAGELGVMHAFRYKEPERFVGKRIVVCGGSISALEIASDQAMGGAAAVHLAQRRQRYVMPKMVAGTPLEYFVFTREGALALADTPAEVLLAGAKQALLSMGGDPARYGAPSPHEDMAKAGVTGSQHYLNLVAEDRIDVRPWIDHVEGSTVTFTDGSSVDADAIIIGTGFDLNLPFLSQEIREIVRFSTKGIELSEFTFHPRLPGLAFIGMWAQLGPYPVVLEQQARYIAYAWGGAVRAPEVDELERGVEACVAEGHHVGYREQHEMAMRFARLAGTDPAGHGDAELQQLLLKSAVTGEMFRLTGPDARPDAEAKLRQDFVRHGQPSVIRAHREAFPGSL